MADTNSRDASALVQLGNLFVAPGQALDYADRHPKMLWLPLGLTVVLNTVLGIWFALTVNMAAWRAAMISAAAKTNPQAAQRAAELYLHHGRAIVLAQFGIGSLIGLLIVELLFALYLFLADKLFSADSRGYGRWLSFTGWTWLPVTLGIIAGMVVWAVSSHDSSGISLLDVTSLNALFFHLPVGSRYYRLAQFSILQFWVIGLVAFGLKRWCGHSTGKAMGIALAPYVLIYGILFLI